MYLKSQQRELISTQKTSHTDARAHTHTHTHNVGELMESQGPGELVAQRESMGSWMPKLSMIECGHHTDGWCSPFLCSQILCRLHKNLDPSDETVNRGHPCNTQTKRSHTHIKNPVVHAQVQWIMETPNNPACTKSVRLFSDEVGHHTEEGQQSLEVVS